VGPARLLFFFFYPGGSAVWPQCWLCALSAVLAAVWGGIPCGGKRIIIIGFTTTPPDPQVLVWRGDLVHAGAGYVRTHTRVHAYVDPPPHIYQRPRGRTNLCGPL